MHKMTAKKQASFEQIRADEAELSRLDEMVSSHIQPNLVSQSLSLDLKPKQPLCEGSWNPLLHGTGSFGIQH
jgi:hypothetical protein